MNVRSPQFLLDDAIDNDTIADDRLEGAGEFAAYVYGSDNFTHRKRVYADVARGIIPAGRWGGKLIGSKRKVRARFDQLTDGSHGRQFGTQR